MNFKMIVFALILTGFSITGFSNNNQTKSVSFRKVYGIHEDMFTRIPPPMEFLTKSGKLNSSNIEVDYYDFSTDAKKAFEYAVSIWETLIQTDQVIKVEAHWIDLKSDDENTVLGAAGPSNFYINKDGLPKAGVFYNAALAEKLIHSGLNNANAPDIYAYFNNKAEWYYGTDGQTPSGKFDLVSVVLHELCHGLGFLGSMNITDDNAGIWSYGSYFPFSYDQFIYNGNQEQLINTALFANPSTELFQQLTSNNLYFDGPVVKAKIGERVILHAPAPYESGSSIDHLNKVYNATDNTLMTPGIRSAQSVHNPGPITMAIMEDIGWSTIFIDHTPVPNQETLNDIVINAQIIPDFDTDLLEPTLNFNINNGNWQKKTLGNTTIDSLYSAKIVLTDNSEVNYYLSVKDKYGRNFYYPNAGIEKPLNVLIGPDSLAPVITHIPDNYFFYGETNLTLLCTATDIIGIDTVYVEYSLNGVNKTPVGLKHLSSNLYNIILNLENLNLQLGDTLRYRIVSKDNAIAGNVSNSPSEGFYQLVVTQLPEYVESYETGFETGANEFVMNGFDISTAKGFSNPALNSEHPYDNGGTDTWLDFTAQFVFPVKIHELYHFILFDEIALVEPGETDSIFGSDSFYDYVIVEGSKDGGKSWIPFEDGWDSRLHSEWENAYNQSQFFDNSEIIGDLNLYKRHQIDLTATDEFSAGDVILLRFRLNSDPFSVGWGWAIDNLKIQTIGLSNPLAKVENFKVYPNPVTSNQFYVNGIKEKIVRLKLFDFSGRLIHQMKEPDLTNQISIPNQLNGLYILYLEGTNNSYRTKLLFR